MNDKRSKRTPKPSVGAIHELPLPMVSYLNSAKPKMLNDDLDISRSRSIESPIIPKRSILYSMPPIGTGTGYVEGLTSYICRLAEAHCVSPTNLLRYIIEPPTGMRQQGITKSVNVQSHPSGDNRVAVRYIDALEGLTMQPNLAELTLSSWLMGKRGTGNIFSSLFVDRIISMLKSHREWCPVCLQEWQDGNSEIYEPLLWSLTIVSICPRHDRLLDRRCPSCQKSQPIIAAKTRVGRCSHCHAWLGGGSIDSSGQCGERKAWLSRLSQIGLAVVESPRHRVPAEMRREILDFLNGLAKNYRDALWWQKYSEDTPKDEISDDDRWILLKILAGDMDVSQK